MPKISLPVDRLVPSQERTQVFTNADALTGDILDFEATLGRAARLVRIETTGSSDLSVRRNVVQMIYPQREDRLFDGPLSGKNINTALGVEKIDNTIVAEEVGPAGELNGPVKNLEVTWSTGNWTIIVS